MHATKKRTSIAGFGATCSVQVFTKLPHVRRSSHALLKTTTQDAKLPHITQTQPRTIYKTPTYSTELIFSTQRGPIILLVQPRAVESYVMGAISHADQYFKL